MKTTTNYGLKKPEGTDVVDIDNFNYNADIIDSELAKRALKTEIPTIPVTSVNSKTGAVTLSKSDVGLGSVNNWGASTAINSTSTTTYATASAVKQAYDKGVEALNKANEAFQSASDGKSKIAAAITGKGVSTSASATFDTMATNIKNIKTGSTVTIDGTIYDGDIKLTTSGLKSTNINFPKSSERTILCEYKGLLHVLGGWSNKTTHYTWNGTSWTSVSTIPVGFFISPAVEYNNELHLLGGTNDGSDTYNYHYKWNGSSWTKLNNVTTSPYNSIGAVVYNNKIYCAGNKGMYYWNESGDTWTYAGSNPSSSYIYESSAVMFTHGSYIYVAGSYYVFRSSGGSFSRVFYDISTYFNESSCIDGDYLMIVKTSSSSTFSALQFSIPKLAGENTLSGSGYTSSTYRPKMYKGNVILQGSSAMYCLSKSFST